MFTLVSSMVFSVARARVFQECVECEPDGVHLG